jgi:hypothetical protein
MTWLVRAALSAVAAALIVVTVPRSGVTTTGTSSGSPPVASAPNASPSPADGSPSCRGLDDTGVYVSRVRFPALTASAVLAGVRSDPATNHLFNDLTGVRPGPLFDPRVPKCRPDLLGLGAPTFVRSYPASTGRWLVPVTFEKLTLVTMFVNRDADGMGEVGGNRGGEVPIPIEATAREFGSVTGDPVVSAELVFGNAFCGRGLVMWRLVRESGAAVYVVLDAAGATPPGLLLKQSEVWFDSSGRPGGSLAGLSPAC